MNVIIEPTDDDEGSYTIPAYTYLKSNSNRVHVGLRNLSCCTVTLHKGTVIAMLSPTNAIPKMLAPKLAKCKLEFANGETPKNNEPKFVDAMNSIPKLTQEHKEKLFSKLDLSGYDKWTASQQQLIDNLIQHYHHIFAVDDLELGRTDMVKHKIKLDNYIPFKEQYRRIPPHQYEEVRKHLDEMLKIGAIRRSSSPWASVIVLVRKRDGALRFCIDL